MCHLFAEASSPCIFTAISVAALADACVNVMEPDGMPAPAAKVAVAVRVATAAGVGAGVIAMPSASEAQPTRAAPLFAACSTMERPSTALAPDSGRFRSVNIVLPAEPMATSACLPDRSPT